MGAAPRRLVTRATGRGWGAAGVPLAGPGERQVAPEASRSWRPSPVLGARKNPEAFRADSEAPCVWDAAGRGPGRALDRVRTSLGALGSPSLRGRGRPCSPAPKSWGRGGGSRAAAGGGTRRGVCPHVRCPRRPRAAREAGGPGGREPWRGAAGASVVLFLRNRSFCFDLKARRVTAPSCPCSDGTGQPVRASLPGWAPAPAPAVRPRRPPAPRAGSSPGVAAGGTGSASCFLRLQSQPSRTRPLRSGLPTPWAVSGTSSLSERPVAGTSAPAALTRLTCAHGGSGFLRFPDPPELRDFIRPRPCAGPRAA